MNIFNRLSLKSLFLVPPFIGLLLILVLFFSSYFIIQKHQQLFQDLSENSLAQVSDLGLISVLLTNNHTKLTVLLVSAGKNINEEQVFERGKDIIHEFFLLERKFETILSKEDGSELLPEELSLVEHIEICFKQYKDVSISAIELATVNLDSALSELTIANNALEKLNIQLLLLTKQHVQILATATKRIEMSLYEDDRLVVLTIMLVFIMLYVAIYFSSRLSADLKQINAALSGLSKGEMDIQLPDGTARYMEQLTTIVKKLKETLLQNEKHQETLKHSIVELNASQNRYHQMFETNQAVKLIIDMETGVIVEANDAAKKYYGYDEEMFSHMSITDINVADDEDTKDNMQLAMDDGEHVSHFRHKLANDEIRDVAVYSGPIQSHGKTLLYSIIHDVTERNLALHALMQSEKKYRSMVQSTVVAIVFSDKSGCILEWNDGAEHMFGYSVEEVHGKSLSMLMPERFKKTHQQGFTQALNDKKLTKEKGMFEFSGLRKNNEEFPLELSLSSWQTDDDVFFSAMILDVSERKRAELGLRRSQKMDAIGQLTGGIAHDFNNILGIILGNLDLLERRISPDEKSQKRIDGIRHSAQRAADLTRQLLGFSRREVAALSITNLNLVITNMQSLIERSLTPQVDVSYQLSENLWLTSIDMGDFEDALLNLILNARDAMSGRGRITLETTNKELDEEYCKHNVGVSPGQYVELAISDDGEGIAHELQERIFEPFFTTKEQGQGTGLGLAMVFGFVQRSKGSIRIYSELGIGTTFRIFLPRDKATQLKQTATEEKSELLPGGSEKVLIVDDEVGLLDVAQETLQVLGYTVFTAESAQQALALLEEHSDMNLILSDVVMPGMNGYELVEMVLQKYPAIKVLLTSGYTEKAVARNKKLHLDNKLLNKPYTQTTLASAVRDTLDEK